MADWRTIGTDLMSPRRVAPWYIWAGAIVLAAAGITILLRS